MKNTGATTHDGRRIVHLTGPFLPRGGLYRVAYGSGAWGSEPEELGCEWDGERPGRLYAYYDSLDEAVRNGDLEGLGDVYCDLHCWGQRWGYTDL